MLGRRVVLCALCLGLASPGTAAEVTPTLYAPKERIAFDRPESWAMKYFTSATLITGFGPPRAMRFGALRLGLEAGWIPSLSQAQRTVGFNGTKEEDLNKLPVFGRLRLTLGLPLHLSVTVAYVPPIPINGVKANLLSFSIGRPFRLTRGLTVGAALYGQVGSIAGDFTCSEADVQAGVDVKRNPLNCLSRSHDRVDANYFGTELSASYRFARAHGLEPYATAAVNYLDLQFHVNARYGTVIDQTRLFTRGATFSTTGGLLFPVTRRLDLAAEVFYTPLTVHRPQGGSTVDGLFNVRGMIAYRFF
jgi:hypothetical protein